MTSDLLRRAAADMRVKAEAATPGPWGFGGQGVATDYWDGRKERLIAHTHTTSEQAQRDSATGWVDVMRQDSANGDHIAAMHPAVALAVADWLDWLVDLKGKSNLGWDMPEDHPALALARTYLGEQP